MMESENQGLSDPSKDLFCSTDIKPNLSLKSLEKIKTGEVYLRAPHEHLCPKSSEVLSYLHPILSPGKQWKGRTSSTCTTNNTLDIRTVLRVQMKASRSRVKADQEYNQWIKTKAKQTFRRNKSDSKALRLNRLRNIERKVNSDIKFNLWKEGKILQQTELKLSKKKKINKYDIHRMQKARLRFLEAKKAWLSQLRNQVGEISRETNSLNDYDPVLDATSTSLEYSRKEKEKIVSKFMSLFQNALKRDRKTALKTFKELDHKENGKLSFIEFRLGIQAVTRANWEMRECKLLFQVLDKDCSGFIKYQVLFSDFPKIMKESISLPVLITKNKTDTLQTSKSASIQRANHKTKNIVQKQFSRSDIFGAQLKVALDMDRKGIIHLLREFDQSNDGMLNMREFSTLVTSLSHTNRITEDDTYEVFKNIDTEGNGTISCQEIRKLIKTAPKDCVNEIKAREIKMKEQAKLQRSLQLRDIALQIPQRVRAGILQIELRMAWLTWKVAIINGMEPYAIAQEMKNRELVKQSFHKLNRKMNQDKKRFLQVFRDIDTDGSGEIDHKELCVALTIFCLQVKGKSTEELATLIVEEVDTDNNNKLNFNELIKVLKKFDIQRQRRKKIRSINDLTKRLREKDTNGKMDEISEQRKIVKRNQRPTTRELSVIRTELQEAKDRVNSAEKKCDRDEPNVKPLLKCQKRMKRSPLGRSFDRSFIKKSKNLKPKWKRKVKMKKTATVRDAFDKKKTTENISAHDKLEQSRFPATLSRKELLIMLTNDYSTFKRYFGSFSPKKYSFVRDSKSIRCSNLKALNMTISMKEGFSDGFEQRGKQITLGKQLFEKVNQKPLLHRKRKVGKLRVIHKFYTEEWARNSPYST